MSTPGADITWLGTKFPDLSNIVALGKGGQKQVFACDHAKHGGVVLKLYHPQGNLKRIQREIEASKTLACPQVPTLHDLGSLSTPVGEVIWVIEQRAPGLALRDALTAGKLSNEEILAVARDVLAPLVIAEKEKKVHRDVKPENIIFVSGATPSASLIDFGLLRALDMESITESARAHGPATLGYAPLEQLNNLKREIDGRADLFGLGITLYECSEGRNPLIDGATDRAQVKHRTETMVIPRITRTFDAAGQFADMVFMMTRTRRDHRLNTVAEAQAWLGDILKKP